ncbi:MAG: putative Ig domain-containing protein [Candidatus Poribacteria bacterium]|nr:putative Ig domain-containing protein [Candidatus Poribacteria bacterium]
MQDYSNFIKDNHYFQPRVIVEIAGEDVSDRLIEKHKPVTDAVLDIPTFNIYATATCRFCLDNSDNQFNTKASDNFFTTLGLPANGWQATVEISLIFENTDAPTTPIQLFSGYLESVTELPDQRWVDLLVLDKSGLLRRRVVENFGRSVRANISGIDVGTDYTDENPVFNLPVNSTPVSRNSFSAGISNGPILNILPTLPLSGKYVSSDYAALDEQQGTLRLGAAHTDGPNTILVTGFKRAYRYRTVEALVYLLLDASGILDGLSDAEKASAQAVIESPNLSHNAPQWSSHGRPEIGTTVPVPLFVRWIFSEDGTFYFGADRRLVSYERRGDGVLDAYVQLSECPDTDAVILQFAKSGSDFYVLTAGTWSGSVAKLWKVTGGTAWSEISNSEATAGHFYDYVSQRDIVADNRKNFQIDNGYLYFVARQGIRRYQLSSGMLSDVHTGGITSDASWDFVSHNNAVYTFHTQRPDGSDTHLRIHRDGTEIFSETYARALQYEPAMVSDVVVRDSDFYFVLTFSRRLNRVGFSELCRVPIAGGTRTVIKRYDNSLFAARSLVVKDDDIYFVEGTWLGKFDDPDSYPTFANAGSLMKITDSNELVDLGPVWQSYRSGSGQGQHTAFPSNLLHDSETDTLHCICGYGLPSDPLQNGITSLRTGETARTDNYVWLQYGQQIAMKIPIFPTNDKTVWELLSELAQTVDFEIGWTTEGYLFFRRRSSEVRNITVDEASYVSMSVLLDSTFIFNYVTVPLGTQVLPIQDQASIDARGILWYGVKTRLFQDESFAWGERVGELVLEARKAPRLKIRCPLKFSPHLQLGDRIEITSEYHSFESGTYFKITKIGHDTNRFQTEIEAREVIEDVDLLTLPTIAPYRFLSTDTVSEQLPVATGGTSPYTYQLTGGPDWLTFDASTRRFSGTPVIGEDILIYQVTDSAGRIRSINFRLTVVLALILPDVPDMVFRKDCYIEKTLPAAVTGFAPWTYKTDVLVPDLSFDSSTRQITGIPEEPDTRNVRYEVRDVKGMEGAETFQMRIEEHGNLSGLYFLPQSGSNKVGVLNGGVDGLDLVREYSYNEKARDPSGDISTSVLNASLNNPIWNGCCAVGSTTRVFVDDANNRGVFFNGTTRSEVNLGVGDWRDAVALTGGNVGFFDFEDRTFRAYSAAGARQASADVTLQYKVDVVSAVVYDSKIWTVVLGSDALLTWNLSDGTYIGTQQMIAGITDWAALAWTGSYFLLLREDATRLFAVSPVGVRSTENDLALYT